jgi:ubiquinone/menaquinone biosynthesis C-methylase UbiE
MEVWRTAISRYVQPESTTRVLDLGCGTGRFASAIADWFSTDVVGIEPSAEMLRAAGEQPHPQVGYAQGRAEDLPLPDETCDWAWLSTVVHHFEDLPRAARELRRVVRRRGAVLIRSWFAGGEDVVHFRYWPGARRIAESFPTVSDVAEAFAAGFGIEALESIPQVSASSLREGYERLRLRADTTLQGLSDEEFAEGLRRLKAEADAETDPQPIVSRLGLLVLR